MPIKVVTPGRSRSSRLCTPLIRRTPPKPTTPDRLGWVPGPMHTSAKVILHMHTLKVKRNTVPGWDVAVRTLPELAY